MFIDENITYARVTEEEVRGYLKREYPYLPDLWSEGFSEGDTAPYLNEASALASEYLKAGEEGEEDAGALLLFISSLTRGFARRSSTLEYLILPVSIQSMETCFERLYYLLQRAIELVLPALGGLGERTQVLCMLCVREEERTPHEVIRNLEYNPEIARMCGLTEEEVRRIRSEDMEELVQSLRQMALELQKSEMDKSAALEFLASEVSRCGVYRSYEGLYYVIVFPTGTASLERSSRRELLECAFRAYAENHVRLGMKEITFMQM